MHFTFALNHIGGILLKWWRDNFAQQDVSDARQAGVEAYALMDERMSQEPSPVMVLPHLNGSGTPSCDLSSKGAILGLTMATTRHDIAKAILEALSFELRINLQRLRECGVDLDELVAVGGGAKSSRWLQIKADIFNRPLRTLRCGEAACMGAALLAGTAAGIWRSLEEGVGQMVGYERQFAPARSKAAAYEERFGVYQQLYPALKSISAKL
jgi:xylulokinase